MDQNALVLHTGPQFSTLTTVAGLTLSGAAFDIGADVGFDVYTDRSNPIAPGDFAYVSNGNDLYQLSLTGGTAGELTLLGAVGVTAGGLTDIAVDPGLIVFGSGANDTPIVTASDVDAGTYSLNGGAEVAFSGIHAFTFNAGAGNDILRIINPADSRFAPSAEDRVRRRSGPRVAAETSKAADVPTPAAGGAFLMAAEELADALRVSQRGLRPVRSWGSGAARRKRAVKWWGYQSRTCLLPPLANTVQFGHVACGDSGKRLVDAVGGIEPAREALNALAKLS